MRQPTFSVILPTRNRPDLLAASLRCALGLRNVDIEVVLVVDDASDETRAVASRLADDRVRVTETDRPAGAPHARNVGLGLARGRWLAFLDDDDLLSPNALATHLECLEATSGARWSCAGTVHIDDRNRIIGHSLPPDPSAVATELRWRNAVPTMSGVVIERQLVVDVGGMDERFTCHDDWDLWLRIAPESRLACVPRPLAAYRKHGSNLTRNFARCDDEVLALRRKHSLTQDADHPQRARWNRARALGYLEGGSPGRAARALLKSVARDRDWRAMVAAPGVVVAPALVRRLAGARGSRRVPSPWRQEAEEWLRECTPPAPS